jgi:hypothetical protein
VAAGLAASTDSTAPRAGLTSPGLWAVRIRRDYAFNVRATSDPEALTRPEWSSRRWADEDTLRWSSPAQW